MALRGLASSTALLAGASVLHAMRVIILSLLLGNREFGAVSTLLLLSVLFAEFGTMGFNQLVYNQPLFTPRQRGWQAFRVCLFLVAGMVIASVLAVLAALLLVGQGPFSFVPLWLTLWCSALNMMIISACRAARSRFTHPVGYAIKAVIISIDILLLGIIGLPLEQMALWGEVAALPILLFYAWYVGILRGYRRMASAVAATIRKHLRVGLKALIASATGIVFFNQDRIFGASFLTMEQFGILTKLLLPKILGAQAAFLLAVQFHRWLVGNGPTQRDMVLARMARAELWVGPVTLVLLLTGGWVAIAFNQIIYELSVDWIAGTAIAFMALVFFTNPYSIILQASGRFADLTRANLIATAQFAAVCAYWRPDPGGVLIASGASVLTWFLLVRFSAFRLAGQPN